MAKKKPEKLSAQQVGELGKRVESTGHTITEIGNALAMIGLPMVMAMGPKRSDVRKGVKQAIKALQNGMDGLRLIEGLLEDYTW